MAIISALRNDGGDCKTGTVSTGTEGGIWTLLKTSKRLIVW